MTKFISPVLFFLCLWPYANASAHGLATTQSKISGEYVLEFEYDTLGTILAGDFTTFSVYLMDKSQNPVHFDKAYLRIAKPNGAVVLVGNLPEAADEPGNARLGGVVPEAGEYSVTLMFDRNQQTMASADYKFTVGGGQIQSAGSKSFMAPAFGIGGLVVGLVLGLVLARNQKTK